MGTDSRVDRVQGHLDREVLVQALDALSQRLRNQGLRANVHIAGGACMILVHQRTRATVDVDALFISEREAVLCAAREVAEEQGLSDEWLNDDVRDLYFQSSMCLGAEPGPALYESPALVVTGASSSHLLAMKAQACRSSDADDIALLMRDLNVTNMDEVRDIHGSVFPHESLSSRKERLLESILQQVLAPGRVDQRVRSHSIRHRPQRRGRTARP